MELAAIFAVVFFTVCGVILGIAERHTWLEPADREPD
jgi:hypothetical protein